jgi:hypothetical protein
MTEESRATIRDAAHLLAVDLLDCQNPRSVERPYDACALSESPDGLLPAKNLQIFRFYWQGVFRSRP